MTRKLIALLLPFALILVFVGVAPKLLAYVAGGWYAPYGADLEGYRILKNRKQLVKGKLPGRHDVLLAGTSRTMADFSASRLAEGISRRCAIGGISAYNLGNVANSYTSFEALLDKLPPPKVLILEFSPHVVLGQAQPQHVDEGMFHRYRAGVQELELLVAARLRQILLSEDPLVINGEMLRSGLEPTRTGRADSQHFYYAMRSSLGYGQRLRPDGQVYYRVYLPDREAAETLKHSSSEYGAFESIHLVGTLDANALSALERIVSRFQEGRQIVVVRPPVSREIYALENQIQRDTIDRITAFLTQREVAYVDMNPSPYYFSDLSHIDWYDTAKATESLSQRLISVVKWHRIHPEGRTCAAESP
jgi:hypothetical protein